MLIKEYVVSLRDNGLSNKDIANKLDVSVSMVSQYDKENYRPSLETAKKVFKESGIALHPFGVDNLKYELER